MSDKETNAPLRPSALPALIGSLAVLAIGCIWGKALDPLLVVAFWFGAVPLTTPAGWAVLISFLLTIVGAVASLPLAVVVGVQQCLKIRRRGRAQGDPGHEIRATGQGEVHGHLHQPAP